MLKEAAVGQWRCAGRGEVIAYGTVLSAMELNGMQPWMRKCLVCLCPTEEEQGWEKKVQVITERYTEKEEERRNAAGLSCFSRCRKEKP